MIEATATALASLFNGDTTLTSTYGVTGTFYDMAPDAQAYPFITIGLVTAPDDYTFGVRAWSEALWQVRAWDQDTSARRAARIMARIDTLLTDQALTVSGYRVLVCRRMETLPPMTELDSAAGLQVRAEGARFLIGVS